MSMQDDKRQEKIIAELYDRHSSEFYDYHAKRGDVKFYVDFAVESGGTVLEIGCGTDSAELNRDWFLTDRC